MTVPVRRALARVEVCGRVPAGAARNGPTTMQGEASAAARAPSPHRLRRAADGPLGTAELPALRGPRGETDRARADFV